MPMGLSKLNSPLLLGILLICLMPLLYLVQWVVKQSGEQEVWLSGTLEVRVDNQAPLILPINLHEGHSERGLTLQGSGTLQEGNYPWEPTLFEASFFLHLETEAHAPAGQEGKLNWAASYTERLTSREDGLGLPPLPCKGTIEPLKLSKDVPEERLSAFSDLQLAVELTCASAGADLLWSSGDERTWTVRGPLSLSEGPIP